LFFNDENDWELIVGSANFTTSAFSTNTEVSLLVSANDINSEEVYKNATQVIDDSFEQGKSFSEVEWENYYKIWNIQQQKIQSLSGNYGSNKNRPLPLHQIEFSTRSWDDFVEKVYKEGFQQLKTRLRVIEIAHKLFERKKNERFDLENFDFSINIFDNDSVYSTLPKLLNFKEKLIGQQMDDIKALTFFFLRDLNKELDIHLKHLYNSFKKYVWSADYQYAYNCFIGIILYADFFKKYPRNHKYSDEKIKIIQEEENEILNFIKSNENIYELTNLSYSKYSHWGLEKAVEIFPIYEEFDFSYDFLKLIFNA